MGGRYVRGVVCCVAAGSAAAFWAPALAPAIGLHHKRGDRAVDGMLATGLGQKGAAGSAAPQVAGPLGRRGAQRLQMVGDSDVSLRVQQMQRRLKTLKVADLRQLLGEFGETGEKMKKAEIVDRIITLTESQGAPIAKPADWSLVNAPHQASHPPPHAVPAGLELGEKEREVRLLPTGVTAYAGEPRNTRSGEEEEMLWGEGEEGMAGGAQPSQDYVREDAQIRQHTPTVRSFRTNASKEVPGEGGGGGNVVPRRGPGSGKRLASSAAILSPHELDNYLQEPSTTVSGGPGPPSFPQTYRGDMSGEASGEGGTNTITARKNTADMELCFLGTASCLPSLTRGVSSIAMRFSPSRSAGSSTWIFDAGEGTQIQMQKSWCRPSTIDKIFITHLHGDHSFGLAGLMCLIGQDRVREEPVEIYGPAGLRSLLRVTLQLTGSRMLPPYRVIELHGIPFLHQRWVRPPSSACEGMTAPRDRRFKEVDNGEDLYPEPDGTWRCCMTDAGVTVVATVMQHTMPCVGYCVEEPKGEDRLRVDLVEDIVERNKRGLQEIYGRGYKRVFKDIKALRPGQTFVMPSGEQILADDVLVPARPGRKVVILGDTCDASSMIPVAMGADVVVHEATNAWIAGLDEKSPSMVEKDTIAHGHSTPEMAGDFARATGAQQLVLTHFSPRYRGDKAEFARRIMFQFEEQARKVSGLPADKVIAAWDLMTLAIERPGYQDHDDADQDRDASFGV